MSSILPYRKRKPVELYVLVAIYRALKGIVGIAGGLTLAVGRIVGESA